MSPRETQSRRSTNRWGNVVPPRQPQPPGQYDPDLRIVLGPNAAAVVATLRASEKNGRERMGPAGPKPRPVRNSRGERFDTAEEAAEQYRCSKSHIYRAIYLHDKACGIRWYWATKRRYAERKGAA